MSDHLYKYAVWPDEDALASAKELYGADLVAKAWRAVPTIFLCTCKQRDPSCHLDVVELINGKVVVGFGDVAKDDLLEIQAMPAYDCDDKDMMTVRNVATNWYRKMQQRD